MVGCKLIQDFIIPSLDGGTYGDLLKWDTEPGIFIIKWTHKAKTSWSTQESKVFKAWDSMKGRPEPKTDKDLVNSKQRLRAALRNIKAIQELECAAPGYRKYRINGYAGPWVQREVYFEPEAIAGCSHCPSPAVASCSGLQRKTNVQPVIYLDDQDDTDPEYKPSMSRTKKPRKRVGRKRRRNQKKTKEQVDAQTTSDYSPNAYESNAVSVHEVFDRNISEPSNALTTLNKTFDVPPQEPCNEINQIRNTLQAPNLLTSDNQAFEAQPEVPLDEVNQISDNLEALDLFASDNQAFYIKQEQISSYERIPYDYVMPPVFDLEEEVSHVQDVSVIDLYPQRREEKNGVCSISTVKVEWQPEPGPSTEPAFGIPEAIQEDVYHVQDVSVIHLYPQRSEEKNICSISAVKVEWQPEPGPSTEPAFRIPETVQLTKKNGRMRKEVEYLQAQAEIFCKGITIGPKRTSLVSQECWADSLKLEDDVSWLGYPRRSKRNLNKKMDYNEIKREPNPECALEERNIQETIYSLDVPNEPTSTSTLFTDVTSTLSSKPQKPKKSRKIKTQETIYSNDVPNDPTSTLLSGVFSTLSVSLENSNAKNPANSTENVTKIKTQAPKQGSSSRSRKSSQKKSTSSNTPTAPTSAYGTTDHPAIKPITPAVYTFPTDSSLADLGSPRSCGVISRVDPPTSNFQDLPTTIDLCSLLDEEDFEMITNPPFSSAEEWRSNNMLDGGDFILGMKLHCHSLDPNCECEECKLIKKHPYIKKEPDY